MRKAVRFTVAVIIGLAFAPTNSHAKDPWKHYYKAQEKQEKAHWKFRRKQAHEWEKYDRKRAKHWGHYGYSPYRW